MGQSKKEKYLDNLQNRINNAEGDEKSRLQQLLEWFLQLFQ
jgi:hypothetical protein